MKRLPMIPRSVLPAGVLGLCLLSIGLAQERPNILLILADDMGYSEPGCFGGEIDTPNLNRLAADGLRFSAFYTAGHGAPSHASLLTGLYPHQAGMGWTANDTDRPGYQVELNASATTIAEVLSRSGYGTYMAGKWHHTPEDHQQPDSSKDSWPKQRGFDHFYGTFSGGNSYPSEILIQGNDRIAPPDGDFHFTDAITDAAKAFLEDHLENKPNQPFFAYVAYTAPHGPLHVPEEDVAKYRARYSRGWDVLRRERFERMRNMRLLESEWNLPARPESVPAWESLDAPQRENMVESMAIYAAQIERMDRGIGRLMQTLEAKDQFKDTLILFLSDNGASAEGGAFGFEHRPGTIPGTADSSAGYGQGWAGLSNTPFREYKGGVHEGGIATPFIVHWPRRIPERGRVRNPAAHLIDIMPTCVEITGAQYPDVRGGTSVPPMEGRSLLRVFKGMTLDRRTLYWEHEGNRAIRHRHWKLVAKSGEPWELYHLDKDRTETHNVVNEFPAVATELSELWEAYATRTQVVLRNERVRNGLSVAAAREAKSLPLPLPDEALLPEASAKPNIILILCDDLGYGDLGCFGSSQHRTPNIDRLAEEGAMLTSFYSTSGFCSPSRASLLTGCYPRRINMHMNYLPPGTSTMRQVLFPVARRGLNPDEITIAEALKPLGYATACIGKWHLGDQEIFLPTRQGFDHYFGIPYSNDMGAEQFPVNPPLPLLRGEEVIEAPVDQTTITKRYTEEALEFIRNNRDGPFFLYLPHTMPHNPVHVSEDFQGRSGNGLYADCVEEIDWSTGQILDVLEELELAGDTLVIFTSDNGAARAWGGGNAPLSGFKGTVTEGGMRVPCVLRWPGQIPAGHRTAELTSTLDFFPTLLELTGGSLPSDRTIDGHNIWPILTAAEDAASPHTAFYYYQQDQLQAVRRGKWKLYLPLDGVRQPLSEVDTSAERPPRLYDLDADIAESENLADAHPEIVAEIMALATVAREDLGDLDLPGKDTRPAGFVERPLPLRSNE